MEIPTFCPPQPQRISDKRRQTRGLVSSRTLFTFTLKVCYKFTRKVTVCYVMFYELIAVAFHKLFSVRSAMLAPVAFYLPRSGQVYEPLTLPLRRHLVVEGTSTEI